LVLSRDPRRHEDKAQRAKAGLIGSVVGRSGTGARARKHLLRAGEDLRIRLRRAEGFADGQRRADGTRAPFGRPTELLRAHTLLQRALHARQHKCVHTRVQTRTHVARVHARACARALCARALCARAFALACTHTHTRTHTHAHARARTHMHGRAHTHKQALTHTPARARARTRTSTHTHACTGTRTHTNARVRTRARTHAHAHTHKRSLTRAPAYRTAGEVVRRGNAHARRRAEHGPSSRGGCRRARTGTSASSGWRGRPRPTARTGCSAAARA
jgi:hypothetical protein